jgi:transposase-like protein
VHKTVNVLDKLPKKLQPEAKGRLDAIWQAATRADAIAAFDRFLRCINQGTTRHVYV